MLRRLKKQRGSITLLGVASIGVTMFAFGSVVDYGNAKILDRELDHYALDVATVALRSELSLTKKMDGSVLDPVTGLLVDKLTYTSNTVDNVLSSAGMSLPGPEGSRQDFNLEKRLTFGNIINNVFVALPAGVASNPKGSPDFIEFSAVAVQLKSEAGSSFGLTPQGKAIYGLPQEAANSTDTADCFCDSRYQSCLTADFSTTLPVGFLGDLGKPGMPARQNYCEYGYVDSHPGNVDKTKYPSIEFSPQWLGKSEDDTGKTLVDFNVQSQVDSYAILTDQLPLEVSDGVNPFPTRTWSFWFFDWRDSGSDFFARNWSGSVIEKGNSYLDDFGTPDYSLKEHTVCGFGCSTSEKEVNVDGFFYVGRKGICVAGTTVAGVQRCLSYKKQTGSTTAIVDCGTFEMGGGCTFSSRTKTVTTPQYSYAQQSCRDFNSNVETKMTFFQWMMSLFFGSITSVDTSYKQLDCSVKKMQSFNISIFNWLPF